VLPEHLPESSSSQSCDADPKLRIALENWYAKNSN